MRPDPSVTEGLTRRGIGGHLLIGPAYLGPASIWALGAGKNVDVPLLLAAGLVMWLAALIVIKVTSDQTVGSLVGTQIAILVFWGWGVVPLSLFSSPALDAAVGLTVVLTFGWLTSHLRSFDWLPAVLGVGVGVASLSMAVTGVIGDWSRGTWPDPIPPAELAGATPGNDLVILVLDAHVSPSILTAQYDVDIGSTLTRLEQSGFSNIDDAYSNYSMTNFSVPSLLSLDYLAQPGTAESPGLAAMTRRVIAGDAGLMAWMSSIGYYVTKFESGWEEDECGAVFRCIRVGWFGNATSWLVIGRTPFRALRASHPYPTTALTVLTRLPQVVTEAAQNARPDFIMAHVLSPHAPLFLNADCENRYEAALDGVNVGSPDMTPEITAVRAAGYSGQVECVTSHLRVLAEAIKGTNTVVLVVGDHGSDLRGQTFRPLSEWTESELIERYSVFATVKVADSCGTAPNTVVNLSRYVVGCAVGVDLPSLPDRFIGSGIIQTTLVDVTERVSSTHR